MRLENRIRRLEESGGGKRVFWVISRPGISLTELRRIEREIKPEDGVFCFDLRGGDKPTKNDAKADQLIESILQKHTSQ